jgi:hypothetical protein
VAAGRGDDFLDIAYTVLGMMSCVAMLNSTLFASWLISPQVAALFAGSYAVALMIAAVFHLGQDTRKLPVR